jgi:hypothetical protein
MAQFVHYLGLFAGFLKVVLHLEECETCVDEGAYIVDDE